VPRQVIITIGGDGVPSQRADLSSFSGYQGMVRRDIAAFPNVCGGTVSRAFDPRSRSAHEICAIAGWSARRGRFAFPNL